MSEHNYKVGDKVRYLDARRHLAEPEYYPAPGTVGTIVEIGDNATCLVQWPEGTTSGAISGGAWRKS